MRATLPLTPRQDADSVRLFRLIAIAVASFSALLGLGALALFLISPSTGIGILVAGEVFAVVCALLTLVLLTRQPMTVAILPLIGSLLVVMCVYAMVFPALTGLSVAGLTLIVILSALASSRPLIVGTAILAVLATLFITLLAPRFGVAFDGGVLIPLLLLLGPLALLGLSWLTIDQLLRVRDAAIALAEHRAAEAEQARAAAEQARVEAETRAEEQARLLTLVQSLELPVLNVGSGVLAIPLVGALDSRRLETIRGAALEAVGRSRAHTVIVDVTGVAEVDTAVARGLIATAEAIRLLGATPVLSGVRASVAQTLASLGVALDGFETVANLQEALAGRHRA